MRVITGKRRGQNLISPKGSNYRPTEDRVKEAVFNVIRPIKEDCVVLDLFACTGSIGIEFLSRGASKVYFSELRYENVEALKRNLENTRFTDQAEVLKGDFKRNLTFVHEKIDYVYLDPPYYTDYVDQALELICPNHYFQGALIIIEMEDFVNFSEKYDNMELVFKRDYGNKIISMYRLDEE